MYLSSVGTISELRDLPKKEFFSVPSKSDKRYDEVDFDAQPQPPVFKSLAAWQHTDYTKEQSQIRLSENHRIVLSPYRDFRALYDLMTILYSHIQPYLEGPTPCINQKGYVCSYKAGKILPSISDIIVLQSHVGRYREIRESCKKLSSGCSRKSLLIHHHH